MAYIEPLFRAWATRMGFHNKQVLMAGQKIGIKNTTTASLTYRGKRELTLTERLAMSAVRAGLQPWDPAYDDELIAALPALPDASAE